MKDDAALLSSYVRDRSEADFTELVGRHLAFVYASALRRVGGDTHFAQDVAQKVFNDLARKASTLAGRSSLAGWLYVGTHLASAEVVRRERRRKTREAEAHLMEKILSSSSPHAEIDWSRLRPLLDDLICELKDEEREAVALRFFEQRPFAEIGSALHLTEEAARKRVERAVEKLRGRLVERGVTSTATMVAFALAEQAVAAPAALTAQIVGTALAQTAAGVAGASLVAATLNFLASDAVAMGAAALAILAGAMWQHRTQTELQEEITRLARQDEAIRVLQQDNQRLARMANETENLRQAVAARSEPEPVAAVPQPVAPLNLSITGKGGMLWEGKQITLDQFISRLRDFHALHPEAGAQVSVVVEDGADFSQMTYVTDEARKAGFGGIVAVGSALPGPGFNWFHGPSGKPATAP